MLRAHLVAGVAKHLNSRLHLHLDFRMCLVQLILHYENAIGHIREREAKDDCACSQSTPVAFTDSKEIEVAASKVFTPENFYLL